MSMKGYLECCLFSTKISQLRGEAIMSTGTISISITAYANVPGLMRPNGCKEEVSRSDKLSGFQMPLHYPRYKKIDFETMPEWRLDCLLKEYGLTTIGDVNQKRKFAMGAFLWPYGERVNMESM